MLVSPDHGEKFGVSDLVVKVIGKGDIATCMVSIEHRLFTCLHGCDIGSL